MHDLSMLFMSVALIIIQAQCIIYISTRHTNGHNVPVFERSAVRVFPLLDQTTIKAPYQRLHTAKRKARQPHFIAYCRAFSGAPNVSKYEPGGASEGVAAWAAS